MCPSLETADLSVFLEYLIRNLWPQYIYCHWKPTNLFSLTALESCLTILLMLGTWMFKTWNFSYWKKLSEILKRGNLLTRELKLYFPVAAVQLEELSSSLLGLVFLWLLLATIGFMGPANFNKWKLAFPCSWRNERSIVLSSLRVLLLWVTFYFRSDWLSQEIRTWGSLGNLVILQILSEDVCSCRICDKGMDFSAANVEE